MVEGYDASVRPLSETTPLTSSANKHADRKEYGVAITYGNLIVDVAQSQGLRVAKVVCRRMRL